MVLVAAGPAVPTAVAAPVGEAADLIRAAVVLAVQVAAARLLGAGLVVAATWNTPLKLVVASR